MDGPFDSPRDDPTWLIPNSPGLDSPRDDPTWPIPDSPGLVSPRGSGTSGLVSPRASDSGLAVPSGGNYNLVFLS
jgi:hypothetical protein